MQAPCFPHQQALTALQEQYGLDGELSVLLGERDQNLKLTTADGRQYVVKISPMQESRLDAEFQLAGLLHLERLEVALGLPRVVPTLQGACSAELDGHPLRVVTWVDGDILPRNALTPDVVASLGRALATLGQGLSDFDHPGKARTLAWDLQRALDLRQRTASIGDAAVRKDVDAAFDRFERETLPRLPGLRRQVIHSDANPENILFDRREQTVTGFIDFGDLVEAPLVADVAIAGSYLRDEDDPLRLLAPFIRAYHDVTPLTAGELELMQTLLRTRLATTLTMAYWRMAELGQDDPYLRESLPEIGDARRFLRVLGDIDSGEFLRRLPDGL